LFFLFILDHPHLFEMFLRRLETKKLSYSISHIPKSFSTKIHVRGVGLFGALGLGTDLHDHDKFKELIIAEDSKKIKSVSAGWGHSAALSEDGTMYLWGRPYDFSGLMKLNQVYSVSSAVGRLFSRSTNSSFFGKNKGYFPAPVVLQGENKITDVCCSAGLTIYLSDNGKVFTFGQNIWMQCGFDSKKALHVFEPTELESIPKAKKISAGLQHGVALTESGQIFSWGKTDKGRLGFAFDERKEIGSPPKEVFLLHSTSGEPIRAVDVSAGFAHSAAVTEDGGIYVWGKGMSLTELERAKGILKVFENQPKPRRIDLPNNLKAVQVYCR
jgi:alpha-tubulin suppressor-like RCC1 family protein